MRCMLSTVFPNLPSARRIRIENRMGLHLLALAFQGSPHALKKKKFTNHLARSLHLNLVKDPCQCSHCEVDVLNQELTYLGSAANTNIVRQLQVISLA